MPPNICFALARFTSSDRFDREPVMQTLSDSFGTIGYDVLGIGQSVVSFLSDVIGLGGGGFGGGGQFPGQYPLG
ncbi:hypothetical protein [Nocardia sp. NPDC020380]|uniref:hypothetical protein n=1 Tax=Nocardia sp. NPDC020380 TaxID=3364309 RepID=UPI0037B251B8